MKPTLSSLKSPLPQGWSLHLHDSFAHLCIVEPRLSTSLALRLADTLSELKAESFYRVLLEENVQAWKLTTTEILTVLESVRQFDFFDMRVAMLSPYRDHIEDLRFLETAAVNRGYDIRVFLEVGPGLAWLLKPEKTLSSHP